MDKHLNLATLESLVKDENNMIANLANTSAFLNQILDRINWVGFYLMNEGELVLGPFQGKVACVHIPVGRGVCGTAVKERKTMLVKNVHEFPGHIACDGASNSEIVVPIFKNDEVIGVLDIDSPVFERFDESDQDFLEDVVKILEKFVF